LSRSRRSLLWTIAGIFLLTAVVGTLLQALVVVAVVEPLETRELRARAELAVSSIAEATAEAPGTRGAALDTLLERHRALANLRPAFMVIRWADGNVVTAPSGFARVVARDSLAATPGASGSRSRRHEVLARRPVVEGGREVGEVQVVRRVRPRGIPGFQGPHTPLLFLPIAILVSIVAGLVVVRLLVARLRAMEVLASRVAEGDLAARIEDRSGDEIGRLAEQLDRMTDRLADARARIEANEHQRRQLFADITHELATPLTSIRGAAETLLDPGVPVSSEERARFVSGVLEESRRLDRLIRDLFDLARLEAGSPLEQEPIDLTALGRNTVLRFEPRFRAAGLTLVWRDSGTEAWIEADGRRIEQVLENLLSNALRYVPRGGTVEVALDGAHGPDRRFRLSVSDDGPGLPADELPHLFERFYRSRTAGSPSADRAAARDQGSGLGLAIVRQIVERHGGTARAEARSPRGLRVVVELPGRP
jgi:signal transduction histidine kinase